ncbi:MAG: hypothetical protein IJF84_11350 [Thermoguttaceae bacterium]|nr:hypothetical protein [Thermoguttaceae bacterium]
MTRKIFALLAALIMAFTFGASQIQAAAPVAEISIGSYETLSSSIETLGKMLDNDQLAVFPKLLETQLGDNLKAFDKSKPSGALVFLKEKNGNVSGATFLAFVPLSDSSALFNILEDNDAVEVESTTVEGVEMKKVTVQEKTVYVVTANGWTFISDKSSLLLDLPKNPAKALGDLPSKYLLAAKLNIDVVPESAKKWVEEQIESGIKAAEAANLEDDEEEVEEEALLEKVQKYSQNAQLKQFKKLLYEFKSVVIGAAFDGKKNVLRFDLDVTPVEGSETAKAFEAYKGETGLGAVVLDDATGYSSETSIPEETKSTLEILGMYKDVILKAIADSDEEIEISKEKLNSLIEKTSDVIEDIVKANDGKVTKSGAAFFFKTDDISFVTVSKCSNIEAIDGLIKDWLKEAGKEADKYFKADTETWEGLTFNVATIPTEKITKELLKKAEATDDEDDADKIKEVVKTIQAIYGDNVTIAYAVGNDSFYFAAGKDAVALIKKVASNGAAVPNGYLDYGMLNVKELIGTFSKFTFIEEDIRDILEAVADSADENTGKIWFSAGLNDNGGATFSLSIDGGIVKMGQTGIMLYLMNNAGGFGGDEEEFEFDLDEDDDQ